MPNIYSTNTGDGIMGHSNVTDWATSRDATTALYLYPAYSSFFSSIRARNWAARGGSSARYVHRSFFSFDTSGISVTPASAYLNIHGYSNGTADLFVVRGTQERANDGDDFDSISGWSAGVDNEGNVTKYSSEITTWDTADYNTITLNAPALGFMSSLDIFSVCLIESVHDLRNVEPTANADFESGCYFTDESGTSKDPYIDYTAGTAVTENAIFFGSNF